jgi:hypothetical protein
VQAQAKDARNRTRDAFCRGRVSQSSEMTAMSRARTEPTFPSEHETLLAREVSGALEAQRVDEKLTWVQIAEAEHEVTTLDLSPAAARLLIDILKVMGPAKQSVWKDV